MTPIIRVVVLGAVLATLVVSGVEAMSQQESGPPPVTSAAEQPPAQDALDVLENAVEGMEESRARILGRRLGESTQSVQADVLEQLDALIRVADQMPTPPSRSSSPAEQQASQEEQSGAEESPDQQEQSATSEGPRRQQDSPQDSSNATGAAAAGQAPAARRRAMIQDVWGHLPPALRQRLLSVPDERPLPKYERLVHKYFEVLAEQRK